MNKRLLLMCALMLCMGALLFPVTAHAASDTRPPVIDAWLEGDTLHAEASDRDSGVEAVYIDGHRIGYLVDGAVEVGLSGYSGDGEYIIVYALDFAGNKSSEVKLKNPHYTAPAPASTPQGTTPAPNPAPPAQTPPASSGSSTSRPSSASQSPATSSPTPSASSEPTSAPDSSTESAIPDNSEANPFTPDGTGSVQDNATEQDGKEFFTIITEDENVFYLIIDRQRDSEGVYLLNAVTEDDLMALAEKGGGTSGESAVPTPEPTPAPQPDPTPEPEPEPEPAEEGGIGTGPILLILLAVLGVGGAGYYFKIMKPKREAAMTDDDDEDDSDYDDDPDDSGDDEDDYDDYGLDDDRPDEDGDAE